MNKVLFYKKKKFIIIIIIIIVIIYYRIRCEKDIPHQYKHWGTVVPTPPYGQSRSIPRVRVTLVPLDKGNARTLGTRLRYSPAKTVCACSTKNDTWSISGDVIGSEAKMPAKCCSDESSDGSFFWQRQRCKFLTTVRDQKLFWSKFLFRKGTKTIHYRRTLAIV